MLKYLIILVFFTLNNTNLFSQSSSKKIIKKNYLGIETGGGGHNLEDPNTGEKYKYKYFVWGCRPGFFIKPWWVTGIAANYITSDSNYLPEEPNLYWFGLFSRFYAPVKFKKPQLQDRLLFFGEISFSKANHQFAKEEELYFVSNKLSESILEFYTGVNVRIYKQLHFEYSIRPRFFIGGEFDLNKRIGLEYHFSKMK